MNLEFDQAWINTGNAWNIITTILTINKYYIHNNNT